MELVVVSGLTLLLLVGERAVTGRGPHHPHAHYRPSRGSPKITKDSSLLQDTGHIQEDLGKSVKMDDLEKMTPEELEFHYFKVHDYDNNTKLDGLEILQAIRHTVEHSNANEGSTGSSIPESVRTLASQDDFSYFVELIDQVLEEDDHDRDGYLSYSEYVVGRQRDSSRKKA